jgi:hypothetical protein
VIAIFALAGVLAFVPAIVDRWALGRGASPETLVALAAVTLAGLAAVPVAFTICTGSVAVTGAPGGTAVVGLMVVALVAGRTLARAIAIRRRWRALAQLARALELPVTGDGVRILPVGEPLAFVAGSEAFISQGLIEHLTAPLQHAVIAHEREHANRRHARLLGAARALAHGAFGLPPISRAAAALDRELDVLADRAAARDLGDATAVQAALRAVAEATECRSADCDDAVIRQRIERLGIADAPGRSRVDRAVRLLTLLLGAFVLTVICLSVHTNNVWLGVIACAVLIASVLVFTGPVLRRPTAIRRDHAGARLGDLTWANRTDDPDAAATAARDPA